MIDYSKVFINALYYFTMIALMMIGITLVIKGIALPVVALGYPEYYSYLIFMLMLTVAGCVGVSYSESKLQSTLDNTLDKFNKFEER